MEKAEVGEAASADKGYEARLEQVIDEAVIPRPRRCASGQ